MEELSLEEKAKRYDQAIKVAKSKIKNDKNHVLYEDDVIEIFPELKESEDERIRKHLIGVVELYYGNTDEQEKKDCLAWLEKHGEPIEINPSEFDLRLNRLLKQFETLPKEELASSLSFYLNVVQNGGTYKEEKQGEQKPADNKGMNLVEEKMTPFQKKVFCIIDTTIEEEQGLKQVCDELLTLASNEIKQKPAWSEEDDYAFDRLFYLLDNEQGNYSQLSSDFQEIEEIKNKLKSLKERYTWKPSDEQIEALLKLEEMHVLEHENNQENAHLYMIIKSIREQLLKLKG